MYGDAPSENVLNDRRAVLRTGNNSELQIEGCEDTKDRLQLGRRIAGLDKGIGFLPQTGFGTELRLIEALLFAGVLNNVSDLLRIAGQICHFAIMVSFR